MAEDNKNFDTYLGEQKSAVQESIDLWKAELDRAAPGSELAEQAARNIIRLERVLAGYQGF